MIKYDKISRIFFFFFEYSKIHRKISHKVKNALYITSFLKWFFFSKQQVLWFLIHYIPHLKKVIVANQYSEIHVFFLKSLKIMSVLRVNETKFTTESTFSWDRFGFEGSSKSKNDKALFWVSPQRTVVSILTHICVFPSAF